MISEDIKEIIKNKKISIKTKVHTIMIALNTNNKIFGTYGYYDLTTGEFFETREELRDKYSSEENIIIKYGQGYESATYVEYHEDIEFISISKVIISKKNPNIEQKETRNWVLSSTVWINKNKEIFTYENDEFKEIKNIKSLPIQLTGEVLEQVSNENSLINVFGKLFPSINSEIPIHFVSANKCQLIKNLNNVIEFIFYKDCKKIPGPKQTLIDKLCSKIDNDIDYEQMIDESLVQQISSFKIEKVDDKYCVLRMFFINKNYKAIEEVSRIFFSKKDVIYTKKNYKNEFINIKGKMSEDFFREYHSTINDFDLDIINNTKLEYYKSFINDIPKNIRALMIILMDKYPVIEKLYKIGLKDYINYGYQNFYALNNNFDVYSPLEKMFKINKNHENNVLKFLGINSYQLKKILDSSIEFHSNISPQEQIFVISEIKELIGEDDISCINKTTFDVYFLSYLTYIQYKNIKAPFQKIIRTLKLMRVLYSKKTTFNLIPKVFMISITPISANDSYSTSQTYLNYYYDYLNIVRKIDDTNNFKPHFSSTNDIKLMHDNIVEIYNLKKEEYEIKAFNKHKEKWNNFIYENEVYKVIYPEKPELLAKEGIELRHCVKSYIDRVISGTTNILFIRKQTDVDKPFFTVEISNHGSIEQIHGFGNRNANTEPGLEDFIKEWQEALGLKARNFNKVR